MFILSRGFFMTCHHKYLAALLCAMSLNVGCSDSEMKSVTAGLAAINSSEKNKPSEVVADSKSSADKSSSDTSALALIGSALLTMADKELSDDKKSGSSENVSAISELNSEADSILSEINSQKKLMEAKVSGGASDDERELAKEYIGMLDEMKTEVDKLKDEVASKGESMSKDDIAVTKASLTILKDQMAKMTVLMAD